MTTSLKISLEIWYSECYMNSTMRMCFTFVVRKFAVIDVEPPNFLLLFTIISQMYRKKLIVFENCLCACDRASVRAYGHHITPTRCRLKKLNTIKLKLNPCNH